MDNLFHLHLYHLLKIDLGAFLDILLIQLDVKFM